VLQSAFAFSALESAHMSDPRDSFGAAFSREAGNSIGKLVAAASDAWTVGLSALQLMAEQAGAAPSAGTGSDPLSALTALTIDFTAAMSDFVASGAGQRAGLRFTKPSSPVPRDAADGTDVSSPMAQALTVGVASALRYWRGLAGVYARHQGLLTRAAAQRMMVPSLGSEAEDRLLVDELRAFFREIGEVAMQEARRLEDELEQVGETLAHEKERPEASAAYRRRWKAKD
jgi:hypothetical protein